MKTKLRSLTPVIGLAVVGLVGTAYATCYLPHTNICADTSQQVESLFLTCGTRALNPKTDWWVADDAFNGTPVSGVQPRIDYELWPCCGTATYTGCDGQKHDINDLCTWDFAYDRVNPSVASCST